MSEKSSYNLARRWNELDAPREVFMPSRKHSANPSETPLVSSLRVTGEESEWWGWGVIELLLESPIILSQFLLLRLENGIRRMIKFRRHRFGRKQPLTFTLRK